MRHALVTLVFFISLYMALDPSTSDHVRAIAVLNVVYTLRYYTPENFR